MFNFTEIIYHSKKKYGDSYLKEISMVFIMQELLVGVFSQNQVHCNLYNEVHTFSFKIALNYTIRIFICKNPVRVISERKNEENDFMKFSDAWPWT